MTDQPTRKTFKDSPAFRVVRNVASILLGDAAGDLLMVYTVALAAVSLGPAGFGRLNEAKAFMDPFEAASVFGLANIALRFAATRGGCDGTLRGTVLGLRLGASVLAVLLAFAVTLVTERSLLTPLLYAQAAQVLLAPLNMVALLPFQWHQTVHQRLAVPPLIGLVRLGGTLLAARLFPSPLGFQLAILASAVAGVLINSLWTWRIYPTPWRFDPKLARSLLGAGWPLGLFGVVVILYTRVGYLLLRSSGPHEQGLFAAADSLVRPILAIATAVFVSLMPTVSEIAVRADPAALRKAYRRTLLGLAVLAVPALGLAWWLAPWLLGRFAPAYSGALGAFRVLSLGTLFVVFNVMSTLFLTALGRFRIMIVGAIFDLVLYLALARHLIPAHGAMGAALATTIMEGVNVIVQLLLVARFVRTPSK